MHARGIVFLGSLQQSASDRQRSSRFAHIDILGVQLPTGSMNSSGGWNADFAQASEPGSGAGAAVDLIGVMPLGPIAKCTRVPAEA